MSGNKEFHPFLKPIPKTPFPLQGHISFHFTALSALTIVKSDLKTILGDSDDN